MATAGRILIMPKGNYDANATYEMLDLVRHNGTSWLAKKTVKGIEPSDANSEYWHSMFNVDIGAIQADIEEIGSKTMTNFGRTEGINIDSNEMMSGSKQGRYFIETAKNPEGTHPEEGHYMLINFPALQIAVIGASTKMYIRIYSNDQWYPWTKFVREQDLKTQYVTTAGTNLDNYREEGKYFFGSAVTPTNIPVGTSGFLIVMSAGVDNNVVKQVWMRLGTQNTNDNETFIRTYNNVSWSNWKKVTMS